MYLYFLGVSPRQLRVLNRRLWATLSRLLCLLLRRKFGLRREVDVELGEMDREHGDVEGEREGEHGEVEGERNRESGNAEGERNGVVNVVDEDVTLHLTAQVSTSAVTRIMESTCCLQ